jgi:putative MATE family efflux protein
MTAAAGASETSGGAGAAARSLDRDIWAMAWPAILSLLLINLVDLVDVAMVGRLGRDSVAAVGYSAQYGHLVRTLLQSVGIACVALMARAIGAGDARRARGALAGSLSVALAMAAAMALLVLSAPKLLLGALAADAHVAELATPYFQLVIGSMLVYAVSVTLESAQRARRNTRIPLAIGAVAACVKIGLNLVLIFGAFGLPRLELVGAGLATLAAELVSVTLYVAVARRTGVGREPLLPALADVRGALGEAREVLRVSLPAIGERLALNLALLAYFAVLGRYGTAAIAAYAIGVRMLAFSWLPGIGFGTASATLVGQALGAGDVARARRAGWRAVGFSLGVMAVLGLSCVFLREPLARAFTSDAAIIEQLLPFLVMLAVAQPFMGVHFTLAGALRGSGDTVTPLLGAAAGNWGVRVPLAVVFAHVLRLPAVWVWAALVGDHVLRATWFVLAFRRGRWASRLGASPRGAA